MPRVPRYTGAQVRSTPLPTVRRTPQQEGAGVGLAIADLGETVARTGLAFADRIVRDEQEKADTAALTEAERRLGDLESLLMTAPDSGALTSVRGKDTLGLKNSVTEKFDQQAGMIASNLTNDRQRMAFERMKESRRRGIVDAVDAHTTRELSAYQANEAKAAIANSLNLGIAYADDFNRVAEERARILGLIEANTVGLGLSGPEQVALAKTKALSALHVGVLDKLIDTNQLARAKAYFEEVRPEIEGDQIGNIEKALTVSNTKKEAQEAFDKILAEGGTFSEQRDKAKAIDDPEVRDATLAYIEHEQLISERAEREMEEARSRGVYDILDSGKGIRAIPSTTWAQMSGSERSAARSYAKSLAENGSAAIKTDYGSLYTLLTLSSTDPDRFMKTNLLNYRNQLSNGDLEQMMRKQADMRGGGSGTQIFASEGIQNEVIDAGLASMGLDMTPAELRKSGAAGRVDAFRRSVREAVDREFPPSAGKRATRADIQAIVDTLAAETSAGTSGWFTRERPSRYAFEEAQAQVETVGQVPPAEKRKIESALRGRGLPVTDQAIVNLFNAQLQKVRGDR